MKPYPKNNIEYAPDKLPEYKTNDKDTTPSRYKAYLINTAENKEVYEFKMTNAISSNNTFRGYYHTTTKYENLYEIAKEYYNDESLYWILAKANQYTNNKLSSLKPGTTVIIPIISELYNSGGYFSGVQNGGI